MIIIQLNKSPPKRGNIVGYLILTKGCVCAGKGVGWGSQDKPPAGRRDSLVKGEQKLVGAGGSGGKGHCIWREQHKHNQAQR